MGNLKVDDDGGMQYWQQLGQQEELLEIGEENE